MSAVTRRFAEQRWLLDNTIRAVGMDWDQPRSIYLAAPLRPGGQRGLRRDPPAHTKLADASPTFEAVARRREAKAQAAEKDGASRDRARSYFMAASTGPPRSGRSTRTTSRTGSTTSESASATRNTPRSADHHVEPAWIPLPDGSRLPAWFHLPPGYRAGASRVVSLPGMDSFKGIGRRDVRRPVAVDGHRRAGARRAGPVRKPRPRDLLQHGRRGWRRERPPSTG